MAVGDIGVDVEEDMVVADIGVGVEEDMVVADGVHGEEAVVDGAEEEGGAGGAVVLRITMEGVGTATLHKAYMQNEAQP